MDGLATQGGEKVFRFFPRDFEIQGIRAQINLVEPEKLTK